MTPIASAARRRGYDLASPRPRSSFLSLGAAAWGRPSVGWEKASYPTRGDA
jgi:hypothetical protein